MLKLRSEKEPKELPNKEENIFAKKNQAQKTSQLLTEESSDAGSGFKTSKDDKTQQEEKNCEFFNKWEKNAWVKLYERFLSIRKPRKLFIDGINAHTKQIK